MRLASRPVEPLLDDDPRRRGAARDRRPRAPRSRLRLGDRVADRDALAGREAVGLDDDAAAGRGELAREPGRLGRTRERLAAGHPDARGRRRPRGRTPCSSRSARPPRTARRPRSRRRQRIGDAGRERRLGADDDELGRRPSGDRHDRAGIERVDARDAADARLERDRVAPGRDDHLVDARLARRASRPARARGRRRRRRGSGSATMRRSCRQPGSVAHRPPGPLDRLGPLRPDRHEDDRHAGVLLDAPRRSAARSRAGRRATGRRGSARTSPGTPRRSGVARDSAAPTRRPASRRAARRSRRRRTAGSSRCRTGCRAC